MDCIPTLIAVSLLSRQASTNTPSKKRGDSPVDDKMHQSHRTPDAILRGASMVLSVGFAVATVAHQVSAHDQDSSFVQPRQLFQDTHEEPDSTPENDASPCITSEDTHEIDTCETDSGSITSDDGSFCVGPGEEGFYCSDSVCASEISLSDSEADDFFDDNEYSCCSEDQDDDVSWGSFVSCCSEDQDDDVSCCSEDQKVSTNPLESLGQPFQTQKGFEGVPEMKPIDSLETLSSAYSDDLPSSSAGLPSFSFAKKSRGTLLPQPNAVWSIIE